MKLTPEQQQKRSAILQQIQQQGGQMTFAIGQTPGEVFRFLAGLEADGLIQEVELGEPLAHTYRLTGKSEL